MSTSKKRATKASEATSTSAYQAFVSGVGNAEQAWGLWKDGWALRREGEQLVFPLWPSRAAASASAKGAWKGFEPAEIPVEDLLDQLLPQLARDGVAAGLFTAPDAPPELPPMAKLIGDLESALGRSDEE